MELVDRQDGNTFSEDVVRAQMYACDFRWNHEPPLGPVRSVDLLWRYLLEQIDSLLEIHAKVNERPLNALALVLLLLEDEHMVVEELLQFLVGEVDAQLLEAVELLDRVAQQREGVKRRTEKKNREEQLSLMLFDDTKGERSTDDFDS